LFGCCLLGDPPFDGGRWVGIQARRDQPGMQGICRGGPSPVDALGVVEGSMSAQVIDFVPGQVVAGSQP